jgi:hypothetical protein
MRLERVLASSREKATLLVEAASNGEGPDKTPTAKTSAATHQERQPK